MKPINFQSTQNPKRMEKEIQVVFVPLVLLTNAFLYHVKNYTWGKSSNQITAPKIVNQDDNQLVHRTCIWYHCMLKSITKSHYGSEDVELKQTAFPKTCISYHQNVGRDHSLEPHFKNVCFSTREGKSMIRW